MVKKSLIIASLTAITVASILIAIKKSKTKRGIYV